nr:hypothetical protein Q903MT_gene1133 [Picea sitchensis]
MLIPLQRRIGILHPYCVPPSLSHRLRTPRPSLHGISLDSILLQNSASLIHVLIVAHTHVLACWQCLAL